MITLPDADIDFKTWFQESIPCDMCDQPARFRSFGHVPVDCTNETYLKCLECYLAWRNDTQSKIDMNDGIECLDCGEPFYTVESFSNYREF